MICVTIGRGRHASLAEEWNAAAEAGVDLVELRIDCLRREPDLKKILAKRPTPLLLTVRRGADGGLWRGGEEKRQALLRAAIAMGIDYVDLEHDVAGKIRRFGKTKRVVSYHNFNDVPADLKAIAEQCDEADADVVKLAVRAATVDEASRVLKLSASSPVPMIALAMGEIGFFTRVLGRKFGAPGPTPAPTLNASSPPECPTGRTSKAIISTTRSTPRPRFTASSATRSAIR